MTHNMNCLQQGNFNGHYILLVIVYKTKLSLLLDLAVFIFQILKIVLFLIKKFPAVVLHLSTDVFITLRAD